jgi:hypothetical protein
MPLYRPGSIAPGLWATGAVRDAIPDHASTKAPAAITRAVFEAIFIGGSPVPAEHEACARLCRSAIVQRVRVEPRSVSE